jgi:hypothetical protein
VSINKTLTLLRQVGAAAVRYGYTDANPVEHVKRPKVARKAKPFLKLDQGGALVDATDEPYRPLVLTLLLARPSYRRGASAPPGATSICWRTRRG